MNNQTAHRVVIVGAGFGGLNAAQKLARAPVSITVIDRKNHHTFQPLLYQVATAGLSPGEIAAPIRSILSDHKNVEVLMAEVTGFDLERRVVQTAVQAEAEDASQHEVQEIPYDSLIVAAGASHAYFGHDEWQALAPGLKTIEDALEIRRRVLLAFELAERRAAAGETMRSVELRGRRRRTHRESNSPEPSPRSAGTPSPTISAPSIRAALAFASSKAARMFSPPILRISRAARLNNCSAWVWKC